MRLSPRAHANFRLLSELVEKDPPCLVFVNSRNAARNGRSTITVDGTTTQHRCASWQSCSRNSPRNGSKHTQWSIACIDLYPQVLKLGIDVGSIRKIVQLESPRSVDRMLQRVGRADHRIGGIGRGHLLAWETDGIAESAVIGHRSHLGFIEDVVWRNRSTALLQTKSCSWRIVSRSFESMMCMTSFHKPNNSKIGLVKILRTSSPS